MRAAMQIMAGGFSLLFLGASLAKVDSWRAWSGTIETILSVNRMVRKLVRRSVPLVEGCVGVLALVSPALGFLTAGLLLAAFAIVAALLLKSHTGAKCSCFGATSTSTISLGLVLKDFLLGGVAIAAAYFANELAVSPLGIPQVGLALLIGFVVLVVREFRALPPARVPT